MASMVDIPACDSAAEVENAQEGAPFVMVTAPRKLTFIWSTKSDTAVSASAPVMHTPVQHHSRSRRPLKHGQRLQTAALLNSHGTLPAQLMRTFTVSYFAVTASTSCCTDTSSVMSVDSAMLLPAGDTLPISACAASSFSGLRAAITTL